MYESGFYKSEAMLKPYSELKFERAVGTSLIIISERPAHCILGLVIDRQSDYTLTLAAIPLVTCSAYIFSFTNYDGVEKAIIYHATSCGPRFVEWIASQIASETDLSSVSIIIATPGKGGSNLGRNLGRNPDYIDLNEKHLGRLFNVGFTSTPQILFDCSHYKITSKGKHGVDKDIADLVFNKVTRPVASAAKQSEASVHDEQRCSCFFL
ncbi:hypothetical protein [Legionella worsleiensis]|uniref:Uncharacterized protein n=1 Tax=Legionella worsleiensis TaxID=45076 RepID=A0A0W1A451_9GAMM|nr:hypothetical protein [Legionella worsleiensis]KTD76141.1 hypothetical protein Lwor_2259 [Legionella worsleiensis]STY33283.1 Uncharacterised protein [Legionella worsleiensis]